MDVLWPAISGSAKHRPPVFIKKTDTQLLYIYLVLTLIRTLILHEN
jgi:hypothetical protein